MNANYIIDELLERIKGLTKEVAFLSAQLKSIEDQKKQEDTTSLPIEQQGVDPNAQ